MGRTAARVLLIVGCCLYAFIALPEELDVDAHPVAVVALGIAVLGALIWSATLTQWWWLALSGALAGAIGFLVLDALTEVNRAATLLNLLGFQTGPDVTKDVITYVITLTPAIVVWAVEFNRLRVTGRLPWLASSRHAQATATPGWSTPDAPPWSTQEPARSAGRFDLTADSVPVSAPAGWYADPSGSAQRRWWDGRGWTDHLQP